MSSLVGGSYGKGLLYLWQYQELQQALLRYCEPSSVEAIFHIIPGWLWVYLFKHHGTWQQTLGEAVTSVKSPPSQSPCYQADPAVVRKSDLGAPNVSYVSMGSFLDRHVK